MQTITTQNDLCGCLGLLPDPHLPNPRIDLAPRSCPVPNLLGPNSLDPTSVGGVAPQVAGVDGELNKSTERLLATLSSGFERLLTNLTTALQSQLAKLSELQERLSAAVAELAKRQSTSDAAPLAASGGFLWKPNAEKDNKLVVLTPKSLGKPSAVRVLSADGKTELATGRFSGIANGDRAHFRFSRPGAEFPDNAIVEISQRDGSKVRLAIPDTAARYKY